MGKSYTFKYTAKTNRLITAAGISEAFTATLINRNDPRIVNCNTLWDTGATNSVITQYLAQRLKLIPTGMTNVSHAGGVSKSPTYTVHLFLQDNFVIRNVRVTECANTNGGWDMIFGMDVITRGDFAITNKGGKTKFSFRIPSKSDIDFEKEDKVAAIKAKHLNKGKAKTPRPTKRKKKR